MAVLIVVIVIAVGVFVLGGRMLRGGRRAQDPAASVQPPPRDERPERRPPEPVRVPSGGSVVSYGSGVGQRPAEIAVPAGLAEARRLRALLLARQVPPTIPVWEVVPEPGEVFFYDVPAEYERYYGRDVQFTPASGFFFGSPAFILAGLAVSGVANASRRNAAEAASRTQWREWARIRLVISNHRLLCLVGGQWVSFHYAAMTAIYPEVAQFALIAEFQGIPPLRLRGVDAPVAAVLTVFATHGLEAVASHPSLQVLGSV